MATKKATFKLSTGSLAAEGYIVRVFAGPWQTGERFGIKYRPMTERFVRSNEAQYDGGPQGGMHKGLLTRRYESIPALPMQVVSIRSAVAKDGRTIRDSIIFLLPDPSAQFISVRVQQLTENTDLGHTQVFSGNAYLLPPCVVEEVGIEIPRGLRKQYMTGNRPAFALKVLNPEGTPYDRPKFISATRAGAPTVIPVTRRRRMVRERRD